jgi:hypothetical protein
MVERVVLNALVRQASRFAGRRYVASSSEKPIHLRLSGVTSDGTEYCRKHSTNDVNWVTPRITYPHANHKKYDKWVDRIENTGKTALTSILSLRERRPLSSPKCIGWALSVERWALDVER